MADLDSIYEQKEDEFLRENDNIVSASLIRGRLTELLQRKKLREKFELLGDTARSSSIARELKYYMEREQSTTVGAIARFYHEYTGRETCIPAFGKGKGKDRGFLGFMVRTLSGGESEREEGV